MLLRRLRMLLGKVKTFPSSFFLQESTACLTMFASLPPSPAGVLHSMEQRSFARRHRHLGKISLQAFLWQVVNLLSSSSSPLPFLPAAPFVHLICSQRLISWVNISTRYYGQFKRCPRFIEPGGLLEGRWSWLVGYFSFAFSVKEEAPPLPPSPKRFSPMSNLQVGRREGG